MRPRLRRRSVVGLPAVMLVASLAVVPAASAHTGIEIGEFIVEIGWREEPALLGQPNAVQVIVRNHDDESPFLGRVTLSVLVSTAGQSTQPLPLVAAFDAAERTGALGEYNAVLVPTAPGDYTFALDGSIRDTPVDVEVTSGSDTFDPVVGSSDLEFPVALPNLNEVATRLDRIDDRIAALQSANPGSGALQVAQEAADAARTAASSADRALLIGALVGGAGVLVAVVALFVAMRAGRRGEGTA